LRSDQRVLLIKRNIAPKAGFWCLPGGFMELGETPEVAALRELKEETGLKGKAVRLLGLKATKSVEYDTILIMAYLVGSFTGEPSPGSDAREIRFFAPQSLPAVAFDSHLHFLKLLGFKTRLAV
jgi:8-oxo-dGTP diphosphatase